MNTELSILKIKNLKEKVFMIFIILVEKFVIILGKWSEILNIYPKIFIRPFCLIVRRFSFFKHNVAGEHQVQIMIFLICSKNFLSN